MVFIKEIILIFLGWFFGLSSYLILEKMRERSLRREILQGVRIEFDEIRFRMVSTAALLTERFSDYDKDFLNWLKEHIGRYRDVHEVNEMVKVYEELSKWDNKKLRDYTNMTRKPPEVMPSLRKSDIPFLDTQMGNLSLLNVDLQNKILAVKTQLSFMNEIIDGTNYFMKLTFDSTVDEKNRDRIFKNQVSHYQKIGNMARDIADLIDTLFQDL